MVINNCRLKKDNGDVSKSATFHVDENLDMKTVSVKWVPHFVLMKHKLRRDNFWRYFAETTPKFCIDSQ